MIANDRVLDVKRITYAIFQDSEVNRAKAGKVVALAAPTSGEGTTYVSRILCRELSRDRTGRTLYCTPGSLAATELEQGDSVEKSFIRSDDGYWILRPPLVNDTQQSAWYFSPTARKAKLDLIRGRFDYAIVDCAAICNSGEVAGIAPLMDAALMVVAAGRSTKKQIAYAEQVVALAGTSFKGCILNRRTYPIPNWIFRFLGGSSQ